MPEWKRERPFGWERRQLHRWLTGNATGNQCARAVNADATPTKRPANNAHHTPPHAARFHIAHFALNKLCWQLRRQIVGTAKRKGTERSQNKSSWKYFPFLSRGISLPVRIFHLRWKARESRTNSGGHFVITVAAISASTFCCFSNNYNSRPKRKANNCAEMLPREEGQRKNTRQEK